jgi:hypothetical protein
MGFFFFFNGTNEWIIAKRMLSVILMLDPKNGWNESTRECDFSHTKSHSSRHMCDINFVDEITYCNRWNHKVYLTHVLWAIAFCVGKIVFSCFCSNFCIMRSNLKQTRLHTRDCESFRGRMEMLELLICFSYMNRCYLAHPYYYVTFGQD